MNDNQIPTASPTAPAWEPEDMDHVVTAILDGDLDPYLVVSSLRPMMAPAAWVELCDALEWCPVHFTDQAICRDDEFNEIECEAGSNA